MNELLEALEATAPAVFLKGSFVAYPLVNAAHILAVGGLVTSVLLLDLRLLGAFRTLEKAGFRRLMRRISLLACITAAVSGGLLFSVRATEYAENPAFLAKLALIALAGLNLLVFTVMERGGKARGMARLPLVLSLLIWPLAIIAGRFIGFL